MLNNDDGRVLRPDINVQESQKHGFLNTIANGTAFFPCQSGSIFSY